MQTAFAADSLFVRKPQIPILIDRTDNILVEMRVQAHKGMYSTSFPCNSKKEST